MAKAPGAVNWPGLVLASASPRRKWLLDSLGADFIVRPAAIDEHLSDQDDPAAAAMRWARAKAESAAAGLPKRWHDRLVLGADTVVSYRHHLLGKPAGRRQAAGMLRLLSGNWHQVMTGVCLWDPAAMTGIVDCEVSRVKFRRLGRQWIAAYVASGEPLDKAGSYGIQGCGALLVERIEGCFYNVMGLPLVKLDTMIGRMRHVR